MRVVGSLVLVVTGLALGAAAWARPHATARLYVRPRPVVLGLWFNPESPIFANNPDLARAVNFALDRPALARIRGRFYGHPTARIIPSMLHPAGGSPYPLDGPHVATAQMLAEESLRGGKATLEVNYGFQGIADEVKRELAPIGLDVTVHLNTTVVCPHACATTPPDMWLEAWSPDDPDVASVFTWLPLPTQFHSELARASRLAGSAREGAFAQLDEDVMTQAPPLAPFVQLNTALLISNRVRCVRWNTFYGVDLAAACLS